MKINEFFTAKDRVIKKPTQFILSNEHKEQQLEMRVKELKNELLRLKEVEAHNEDLKWRESNYSTEKRETLQLTETLSHKLDSLTAENERLKAFESENQGFHSQIKQLTSTVENLKGVTELAQSNSMLKDKELLNLQTRFDILFKEEASIRSELNHSQNKIKTREVELAESSKIYNETKDLAERITQNFNQKRKQFTEAIDSAAFWEARCASLTAQVEQLEQIEKGLRKWTKSLTDTSDKTTGMNKMTNKKLSKAQNTISEMGNTIDELVQELKYVREVNAKLQYEVSRPRYASMGAIAKNEGFVMPMGKENIRTKFLGNSTPKLLKFKEKHNDN